MPWVSALTQPVVDHTPRIMASPCSRNSSHALPLRSIRNAMRAPPHARPRYHGSEIAAAAPSPMSMSRIMPPASPEKRARNTKPTMSNSRRRARVPPMMPFKTTPRRSKAWYSELMRGSTSCMILRPPAARVEFRRDCGRVLLSGVSAWLLFNQLVSLKDRISHV